MILDVCSSLSTLLIPVPVPPDPDTIARIVLDTEPLEWITETLYVYPVAVDEVPFETASGRRQEFDLMAVYVTDNDGEEAQLTRSPALAIRLDDVRGTMLAAIRDNQSGPPWGFIRGSTNDTSPRTLDKRSASVRITGWRIVGGG